jgi:uncharacterized protein (TIGR02284 family)
MATTIGTEHEVIDMLNNLIHLDFDAIAAYESAIDRLDHAEAKTTLIEFKNDHERHTRELGTLVRNLGGEPSMQSDAKSLLTQGKVVLRGLTGDSGILKAMKSNEDETNEAYEQALDRGDMTANIRDVLERNLADERRHRAWIEGRLAQM